MPETKKKKFSDFNPYAQENKLDYPAAYDGESLIVGDIFYTGTIVGVASYLAGGFELDLSSMFKTLKAVIPVGSGGYVAEIVEDNFAEGKCSIKALWGNYDAADGVLIEIPDGTNISSITFRYVVIGTPA